MEFFHPVKYYEHTLIAMSYSKFLSIAGERIGFLAVSPRCASFRKIYDYCVYLNRTLGYINAPALMQRIIGKIDGLIPDISVYQRKRDLIYNGLIESGYEVIKPEGTFYIFPESPIEDDITWVRFLQKNLVLTSPGSGFSYPGYFRMAFCVSDEVITGAIPVLKRCIEEIKK
jgi:aspartate aminotransferase